MLPELIRERDAIVDTCRRLGVRRLVAFGSAVDGDVGGHSDIDFLVEFDPASDLSRFDAYFDLKEELEALLARPVDLVSPTALDNPYFAATVDRSHHELYAA